MHGLLRRHPARGPRVELPELFPRLPPELHKEMGSIAGLSGRRCADTELRLRLGINVPLISNCFCSFSDSAEGWRCPACQNVAPKPPTSYTCFCGERRTTVTRRGGLEKLT